MVEWINLRKKMPYAIMQMRLFSNCGPFNHVSVTPTCLHMFSESSCFISSNQFWNIEDKFLILWYLAALLFLGPRV